MGKRTLEIFQQNKPEITHSRSVVKRFLLAILLAISTCSFVMAVPPGDVNGDSKVDLADAVRLANYVFKGTPFPYYVLVCIGDVNSSCRVDVVDIVYLANYVLKSTAPPQATTCGWNPPVNLGPPVNTQYNEDEPHLNLNLSKIYFTSDRPNGLGGWDIWYSQKSASNWGNPVNLGNVINSAYDDISPSPSTNEQELYFCSNRPGGFGGYDIYVSRWDSEYNLWLPAVNLGSNVNTAGDETGVFVDQYGSRIYFSSTGWGNALGALYYSDWLGCEWGLPTDMGPNINQVGGESSPSLSPGGSRLYFQRGSGSFYSRTKFLGSAIESGCGWNLPFRFCLPSFQIDPDEMVSPYNAGGFCELMYFASNRSGGQGELDLWVAESTFDIHLESDCYLGSWFAEHWEQASPDGSQIVFKNGGNCYNPVGIYLTNSNGTNRRLLIADLNGFTPGWSPDGQWIVFSHALTLYKIKTNGDSLTQLTFGDEAIYPDWSPEGERIAYTDGSGPEFGTFIINIDGSNRRKVSKSLYYTDWSSDGSRLLGLGAKGAIVIADTLGNILKSISFPNPVFIEEPPRWNSDESEIVFSFYSPAPVPTGYQIGIIDTTGTNFRQLTKGGGKYPSVLPSGQILFVDGRVNNGGIWIMDMDGCNQRAVTKCEDRCPPVNDQLELKNK